MSTTDRTRVQFDVADDGEHIDIAVECHPVSGDHVARVTLRELEQVSAQARARQLGVDARGRL